MSEEIYVSDHAVIRWLERVHEIDIEYFRNKIKDVVREAIDVKATSITVDGFCYMLDPVSRSVVSIISEDMKFRKKEKENRKAKHWLRNRKARFEEYKTYKRGEK